MSKHWLAYEGEMIFYIAAGAKKALDGQRRGEGEMRIYIHRHLFIQHEFTPLSMLAPGHSPFIDASLTLSYS